MKKTLTYMKFSYAHWLKIRTSNVNERLNKEIRCRTRMAGTVSDRIFALMMVFTRLRRIANNGNNSFHGARVYSYVFLKKFTKIRFIRNSHHTSSLIGF